MRKKFQSQVKNKSKKKIVVTSLSAPIVLEYSAVPVTNSSVLRFFAFLARLLQKSSGWLPKKWMVNFVKFAKLSHMLASMSASWSRVKLNVRKDVSCLYPSTFMCLHPRRFNVYIFFEPIFFWVFFLWFAHVPRVLVIKPMLSNILHLAWSTWTSWGALGWSIRRCSPIGRSWCNTRQRGRGFWEKWRPNVCVWIFPNWPVNAACTFSSSNTAFVGMRRLPLAKLRECTSLWHLCDVKLSNAQKTALVPF